MRPIRPCAASTSCAADLIVAAQASSVTPSNPMLPIVQARIRPLAVRDDLRHWGVVARKPVGRPEAVGDLLPGEAEGAA